MRSDQETAITPVDTTTKKQTATKSIFITFSIGVVARKWKISAGKNTK